MAVGLLIAKVVKSVANHLQRPPHSHISQTPSAAGVFRCVGSLHTTTSHLSHSLDHRGIPSSAIYVSSPRLGLTERVSSGLRSGKDLQNSNFKNATESNIGKNISIAEKRIFLVNTLLTLEESKEAVYGTLDAWVAWETNFPLVSLKKAILVLEKEEQWHRVVQVIKWILSKGQGTTMGTYEQLIRALEKDNRAEEAHRIWMKKISHDLHSVPWRFCDLMISIYYRNNMLERLVKLFQSLESFGRKYPTKSIVRKVADAYIVLDLLEEKNKLLEKYNKLFSEESDQTSRSFRKSKRTKGKDDKRTGVVTCVAAEASTQIDSGPSDAEIDSML
ncbi:pentatricopeptide repeat-containing protein At4g21190-like [Zingiber officinale]|uniref:pentatricopeptide repeat-containing protein At4g21190-like n=1 Tax=Zingiber officinale TaxID=94328 RepID=UPI001C4C0736|nr:pentatricopeptide repeat-containing protein At4g21190-like [Zingiber officinale]